jgi:hypothetical protein
MTRALFVADQFSDVSRGPSDKHPGGAELTDEAAISACPWPLSTTTFGALRREASSFLDGFDVIVVGNSETAAPEQLEQLARTRRHVAFEHDLRICRWRGNFPSGRDPVHKLWQRCWCPHLQLRRFFDRARGVVFLTGMQERYYRANASFATSHTRILGSSLFGAQLLELAANASHERTGTAVFASRNPIKGHAQALRYCRERGLAPREIRDLSPVEVLARFAQSERFVYLPIGPEWAGRMVVEARMLGASVVVNEHVGVAGEPFWLIERDGVRQFLRSGPRRFWTLVEELMNTPELDLPRAPSRTERALDQLSVALRRPKRCFWPVGPGPLGHVPAQEYPAW